MESAGNPPTKPRAALGGRFFLEEQLGIDASGELHRGIDLRTGTTLAVRVVRGIGAARREKLLRETNRAALVKHPGLAVVLGVGQTEEGDIFVAAETIVGDRLSDRLRVEERFDDWEAAEIATQIAHAVAAAHESDVVHRELRPSLIVLTYVGDSTIVKVEGLGLPRAPSASDTDPELAYSAPEQRRGEPVGRRADVYSIGAMLSAMLTGSAPAPGDPQLHGPLGGVVACCLSEDPKDRYADTVALTSAMTLTVESLPPRVPSRMPMAGSVPPAELASPVLLVPKAPDSTTEDDAQSTADPPSALRIVPPAVAVAVISAPAAPAPTMAPVAVAPSAGPAVSTSAPAPASRASEPSASDGAAKPGVARPGRASSALMPGAWPLVALVAVVAGVTFLVALLLTSVVGAVVTALGASVVFYVAWTKSRSTPRR